MFGCCRHIHCLPTCLSEYYFRKEKERCSSHCRARTSSSSRMSGRKRGEKHYACVSYSLPWLSREITSVGFFPYTQALSWRFAFPFLPRSFGLRGQKHNAKSSCNVHTPSLITCFYFLPKRKKIPFTNNYYLVTGDMYDCVACVWALEGMISWRYASVWYFSLLCSSVGFFYFDFFPSKFGFKKCLQMECGKESQKMSETTEEVVVGVSKESYWIWGRKGYG